MSRPARDKRSRSARSHQTTSSSSKRAHRSADFAEEEEEQDEKTVAVAPTTSVVDVLLPVRTVFQAFLTDGDVGRLMPLSRSFTTSVLSGFRFRRLFMARSAAHLRRLAVYERYGLLISCMHFAEKLKDKLTDRRGRSLLPASLLALAMGYVGSTTKGSMFNGVVKEFFDRGLAAAGGSEEERLAHLAELLEEADVPVEDPDKYYENDDFPSALVYDNTQGIYDHPLTPGTLPVGLRFLKLGNRFDQPLEVGSIPPTVVYVAFCDAYDQPLSPSLFPPSVKVVVLQWMRDHGNLKDNRYGCGSIERVIGGLPNVKVIVDYYWFDESYNESCGEDCHDNDAVDEVGNCVLHGYQRYRWLKNVC